MDLPIRRGPRRPLTRPDFWRSDPRRAIRLAGGVVERSRNAVFRLSIRNLRIDRKWLAIDDDVSGERPRQEITIPRGEELRAATRIRDRENPAAGQPRELDDARLDDSGRPGRTVDRQRSRAPGPDAPHHLAERLRAPARGRAPHDRVTVRLEPSRDDLSILRTGRHRHDAFVPVRLDGQEHPPVPEREQDRDGSSLQLQVPLEVDPLDGERRAVERDDRAGEAGKDPWSRQRAADRRVRGNAESPDDPGARGTATSPDDPGARGTATSPDDPGVRGTARSPAKK